MARPNIQSPNNRSAHAPLAKTREKKKNTTACKDRQEIIFYFSASEHQPDRPEIMIFTRLLPQLSSSPMAGFSVVAQVINLPEPWIQGWVSSSTANGVSEDMDVDPDSSCASPSNTRG
jgi:hypothetical protein